MSKPVLRFLGGVMALLGALILAYAAYSYTAQRQLESRLEAQIPGQNAAGVTTTPIILMPSLASGSSGGTIPGARTDAQVSPSVTPMPLPRTPIQPDATVAAALALTPLATDRGDLSNLKNRPTPAPTDLLQPSRPRGVPRGTGSPATRLRIPKLNLDLQIKAADYFTAQQDGQTISDWQVPYDAAGHLITSAQPGEIGNAVLSGHHNLTAPNTFGLGVFAGLWNLASGDEVDIQTADGKTQIWRITDSFPVKEGGEPLAVRIEHAQQILSDTPFPTLTLLTCWNGKSNPLSGNLYRWVVHAELLSSG